MLALAITISALVLIALLRFGVIVDYSEAGFQLWASAGFLKFRLLDDHKKIKPKKLKKPVKKVRKHLEMKPGSLSDFTVILKAVLNVFRRLKRRLLIKQLSLYYTSAGEDPAATALRFGAANAVFAAIVPGIKETFRVRRIDLRTWFDFNDNKQGIYAKIAVSLAVWEAVYISFALLPAITAVFKVKPGIEDKTPDKNDRKDGQENGNSPDQRTDGNNDAKNEGND